ncbi:common central domain of tyrosinase-domain-containing protein [Ilyonectria destructans]|nr:common central domain of tyrosinase-domain-containing protein [Ilyonectria destructans]
MAPNTNTYAIEGIQDGLDSNKTEPLRKVHLRMEADDWYLSQDIIQVNQRALFFPAFWRFSQMDPRIHGMPYISWDEKEQQPATPFNGYCTHNSILFVTWHRPYMLLWEQVIYHLMKDEAKKYDVSNQPDLLKAAEFWRFPYWDWALKKPDPTNPKSKDKSTYDYNVPVFLGLKEVEIRLPTPQGFGTCRNAFYQFEMSNDIAMGDESLGEFKITKHKEDGITYPFDLCKGTSRQPQAASTNDEWVKGQQNNDLIVEGLRDSKWENPSESSPGGKDVRLGNMTSSLRDSFYRVLTIDNFEAFATKRAPAKNPGEDFSYDSSEHVHDSVHGWCGGAKVAPGDTSILQGHMSHVPVAAFDPIFWLHHCNIDRLFAIWQVLHDDSWFTGNDIRDKDLGNFYIPPGTADKPTDALRPFHKTSDGQYYTSDDIREVTPLGYTYPGLEKWEYTAADGSYDKARHIEELTKTLNYNYNASWAAAEKSELTADPGQMDGVGLMSLGALVEAVDQEPKDLLIDDYVVNVVYEKFALGGRMFIVHIFIGEVPAEPPYTTQDPNVTNYLVGEVINLSAEIPEDESTPGCGSCRNQEMDRAKATGRVILTNALITRWKNEIPHNKAPHVLQSMEREDVVNFLKANLHWRVTSLGQPVDLNLIPSLKVSLAVGKAQHWADRTKMSRFYDYQGVFEVTEGRDGGAEERDGMYPPDALYRTSD